MRAKVRSVEIEVPKSQIYESPFCLVLVVLVTSSFSKQLGSSSGKSGKGFSSWKIVENAEAFDSSEAVALYYLRSEILLQLRPATGHAAVTAAALHLAESGEARMLWLVVAGCAKSQGPRVSISVDYKWIGRISVHICICNIYIYNIIYIYESLYLYLYSLNIYIYICIGYAFAGGHCSSRLPKH